MSFLSCCKCEGSRDRRGLLDSITAQTHLPHCRLLLRCSILQSQFAIHANSLWVRRGNSAALTANLSHWLPQMAPRVVNRRPCLIIILPFGAVSGNFLIHRFNLVQRHMTT